MVWKHIPIFSKVSRFKKFFDEELVEQKLIHFFKWFGGYGTEAKYSLNNGWLILVERHVRAVIVFTKLLLFAALLGLGYTTLLVADLNGCRNWFPLNFGLMVQFVGLFLIYGTAFLVYLQKARVCIYSCHWREKIKKFKFNIRVESMEEEYKRYFGLTGQL